MAFRLAFSTLRWKTPDLESLLGTLRDNGWDGWETRQSLDWLGSASRVRRICDRVGIEVAAVCGPNVFFDREHPSNEINRRQIEFASDMGCGMFTTKGPRRFDHDTTDEELDQIGEIYEDLAVFAEPLGVVVAYHPHRGHAVDTADEWKRLMTRLDACKLCLDMSHAVFWEYDPVEAVHDFRDRIVYVHLHDYGPDGISVEIGEGMMYDYPAFMEALEEIGYSGWITACPGRIERADAEKIAMSRDYLRRIGY